MPLSIKNPRAEELAAAVAKATGESLTEAVIVALSERLERLTARRARPDLVSRLSEIATRCEQLPDVDTRGENELLGYGADGTFDGKP